MEILEATFTKVNLEPGEVLFVTVTSDDMTPEDLGELGANLRKMFPNNKVVLLCPPTGTKIELTSVKDASSISPCADPVQYCTDCSCGKKARLQEDIEGGTENEDD